MRLWHIHAMENNTAAKSEGARATEICMEEAQNFNVEQKIM